MKCEHCGFENELAFSCCPNCGAPATAATSEEIIVPTNSAADRILRVLKDPLFFVLCILMSASCALQLISSGINVLTVLFTIFLWLTYAQVRKDIADAKHLRCISGTVYAEYILVNVSAILLIVCGALFGLAFGALAGDPTFTTEILSAFDGAPIDTNMIAQLLGSVSGVVIFVVFALIGAAMLVINLFSTRYIHRFAKSVYQSVEDGTLTLKHGKTAYGWLWVFGIFSGISFLGTLGSGDLIAILADGSACAMPIIAALLMKKYSLSAE